MQNIVKIEGYDEVVANTITVSNADDLERASAFLRHIKLTKEKVEHSFNPIIEQAHKAHKEAIARRNEYLLPLIQAECATKQKVSAYLTEQERIKEQEKQRQLALIRKQEEEQRKRIEEEALRKAQELTERNKDKQAEQVLVDAQTRIEEQKEVSQIQQNVVQQFSPAIAKPANISMRKVYKFKVVSLVSMKPEYLIPNEQKIRSVVSALKKDAEKIVGGIEVYEENIIASR